MKNVLQTSTLARAIVILAAAALAAAGCKDPGPVELVDDGDGGQIEVVSPPPAPTPGMEMGDADSAGIIPPPPGNVSAHLLVAGGRYDGQLFTSEASLSRAIFFDRSAPIVIGPGRTAYRTLDVGAVVLNLTPLLEVDKLVKFPGGDTLLGPQYFLYNRLPAGFRYTGGTDYQWAGTGNGAVQAFTTGIVAPAALVVQNLTPATVIRVDEPLRVRWTGGGAEVQLVISHAGETRIDSRPILHLRLGPNNGSISIPPRILALLPRDRNRFVFTFLSDAHRTARIGGYPDDVLVQALTSHSIVVQVGR